MLSSAAHPAAQITLGTDKLADLLKSIHIPPCPAIVTALLAEAQRPDVDFNRITRLITADPGLSASLVKAANSPLFARRGGVATVNQAAALLGLRNIINIVNSLALKDAFKGKGNELEEFWEHSSQQALVAAHLAVRVPGVSREEAYAFGLFHDCGIPVLMQRFPDYGETLREAEAGEEPLCALESRQHGTDHVTVGAMLARNWHLPARVVHAIRDHHNSDILVETGTAIPPEVRALTAISHLAHHLTSRRLGLPDEAEWTAHGAQVVDYLGFDREEVEDLYQEVDGLLAEEGSRLS